MVSVTKERVAPPSRFDALAEQLSRSVPEAMRATEWAAGYGVFGVEFESGDLLALRHFPYSAIGAYSTIWHRSADGIWRMYFDAPRPDLACPRYFSDALFDTEQASIELDWQDGRTLEARASRRHLVDLRWRVTLGSSARTSLLNAASGLMPPRLTVAPSAANAMARVADVVLGMGGFAATGRSPNGQRFLLQPKWMAPIRSSSARLNTRDIGALVTPKRAAAIGEFVVPRRPLFAVGWAYFDPAAPPVPVPAAPVANGEEGELLSKYVCQRLVSRVIEAAHQGTFGGERTVATVLFIDIHGFTGLAERCEPERVMQRRRAAHPDAGAAGRGPRFGRRGERHRRRIRPRGRPRGIGEGPRRAGARVPAHGHAGLNPAGGVEPSGRAKPADRATKQPKVPFADDNTLDFQWIVLTSGSNRLGANWHPEPAQTKK